MYVMHYISGYKGQSCEIGPTTTSTSTTTTKTTTTPSTTTVKPCTPVNNCIMHYTCNPRGDRVCMAGWTGVYCDTMIPDGDADCDNFKCKPVPFCKSFAMSFIVKIHIGIHPESRTSTVIRYYHPWQDYPSTYGFLLMFTHSMSNTASCFYYLHGQIKSDLSRDQYWSTSMV